jgi:A/G-specific adenine glycosylase
VAAGIVWRGDRLLVARRPRGGLLGGLWEFPGGKRRPGEDLAETCVREVREETGLAVECVAPFLTLRHVYSHFRVTIHLFHCLSPRGRPVARSSQAVRFVRVEDLRDYPFPRANRRALEALAGAGGRPSLPARRAAPSGSAPRVR